MAGADFQVREWLDESELTCQFKLIPSIDLWVEI